MRLKRGKGDYKIGPFGLWHGAEIQQGSFHYAVMNITGEHLRREKERNPNLLGFPVCVFVPPSCDRFELWPKPDKNYTIKVRYYPCMVEK